MSKSASAAKPSPNKQSQNIPPRSPGRPKGSPNKTTAKLKDAILMAAEDVGVDGNGTDGLKGYLVNVAKTDVKAFAGLLGRVLPLTLSGDPDNPLEVNARLDAERFTSAIARLATRSGKKGGA